MNSQKKKSTKPSTSQSAIKNSLEKAQEILVALNKLSEDIVCINNTSEDISKDLATYKKSNLATLVGDAVLLEMLSQTHMIGLPPKVREGRIIKKVIKVCADYRKNEYDNSFLIDDSLRTELLEKICRWEEEKDEHLFDKKN